MFRRKQSSLTQKVAKRDVKYLVALLYVKVILFPSWLKLARPRIPMPTPSPAAVAPLMRHQVERIVHARRSVQRVARAATLRGLPGRVPVAPGSVGKRRAGRQGTATPGRRAVRQEVERVVYARRAQHRRLRRLRASAVQTV